MVVQARKRKRADQAADGEGRHVEAGGAEQGKADAKSAKAGCSVDGERCHRIVDDRRVQPVHERPRTCCA